MDILKLYLPLSWFQGNPLELPKSSVFFKYSLLFYYAIELFMQLNMVDDPLEAFSDVTMETILTLLFVFTILFLNSSLAWYMQVTCAILVGESLISLIALPVLAWITVTESTFSYICLTALILWDLLFVSYIIKQVLSINRVASIIMGIFYFIATYLGVFAVNVLLAL